MASGAGAFYKNRRKVFLPVGFRKSRSSLPQRQQIWRPKMTSPRYRWVIVAAGGLLGCVAIGGMFSLPVFLKPIAADTGWAGAGILSAMTLRFLAMGFTST